MSRTVFPSSEMISFRSEVVFSRLSEEDVHDGASVYAHAFAESRSGKLGPMYSKAFLKWFISEPAAIAVGVGHGGRLIGFAVGAPLGYQRKLNRDLAWIVARCLLSRPRLLVAQDILRGLGGRIRVQFGRVSHGSDQLPVPEPVMCLVGTAITPAARGLGIGWDLYRNFEKECRDTGYYRSMRGITHKANASPGVIKSRLGWKPFQEDEHGYVSWYKVLEEAPEVSKVQGPTP